MLNSMRFNLQRVALACLSVAAMLLLSGCGPSQEEKEAQGLIDLTKQPTPSQTTETETVQDSSLKISLEPVADGIIRPTFVTESPDGTNRLFITEKTGRIRIFQKEGTSGTMVAEPFLDIGNKLASTEKEQGLCGLAFHPQYAKNGRFFVHYTDTSGTVIVAEYARSADNPNKADPAEKQVLIREPHKLPTHNGGMLAFGPDGYLYISLGDGGCCDDPFKNSQKLDTLLGKILRLDVDKEKPYVCPTDNPIGGRSSGRGEIWAYGMRNPWRFSFDSEGDHQMFCGDAGRLAREEVDIIVKGGNYGWPIMEGDICYVPPGSPPRDDCDKTGKIMPISVYDHMHGDCCIIGGYVYRGKAVPDLVGKYLFGDFCSGKIWALTKKGDKWEKQEVYDAPFGISSFGEDLQKDVYVCEYVDMTQPFSRIFRIRPSQAPNAVHTEQTTVTATPKSWEEK